MRRFLVPLLLLSGLGAGCRTLEHNIADFENDTLPVYQRQRALQDIAQAGAPHRVERLRRDLRLVGQPATRRAAARTMGALGSFIFVPDLHEAAADRDPAVQAAVIAAQGEIERAPYPSLIEAIVTVARAHDDFSFRAEAIATLGELRDQRVARDLAQIALDDEEWLVRARAVQALGTIGGDAAVDALLAIAAEDDPELQRMAKRSLAALYRRMLGTLDATATDLNAADVLTDRLLGELRRLEDKREVLRRQQEQLENAIARIEQLFGDEVPPPAEGAGAFDAPPAAAE